MLDLPIPQAATDRKRKLSLALAGFSNAGKTYTSMAIAKNLWELEQDKRWLIIDVDSERSSIYSKLFNTEEWLDAIYIDYDDAINAKLFIALYEEYCSDYSGIIFDGITPFWHGVRRHVTEKALADSQGNPNEFNAWDGKEGGNALFFTFLSAICHPRGPHTISTIDMKEGYKYAQDTMEGGKKRTKITKIGPVPIFRPGEHRFRFNFFATTELSGTNRNLYFDKATGCDVEGVSYTNTFPVRQGQLTVGKTGKEMLDAIYTWLNHTVQK